MINTVKLIVKQIINICRKEQEQNNALRRAQIRFKNRSTGKRVLPTPEQRRSFKANAMKR